MKRREPFEGAGEIGLADSGWQTLVISQDDEVGPEGTNRGEKIFMSAQKRACPRKSLHNVFEAHAFRFLGQCPLDSLDSGVAPNKNEEFSPPRSFLQEEHMSGMEAVKGAANEDAHHFFWRSMT